MKALFLTLFVAFSVHATSWALAAPGNLDPSFSDNGLLSSRPGNSQAQAIAIAQQADGKLVLAGWSSLNGDSSSDFMVARVAEDGTPDSTFGTGGFATVDYLGRQDFALDVVLQPDGKIVLAGTGGSIYDGDNIAIARFDSNGMLDASFSGDGIATFDDSGGHERAFALILQGDSKLVVAGAYIFDDGRGRPYLSKLNADGTRDTTFAPFGRKSIDFGDGFYFLPSDMLQQSDGKLVIVGTVQHSGLLTTVGIARVTANGDFDSSFDGDGRLVIGLEQGEGSGVAVQPDGAIVVAGFAVPAGGTGGAALIRVNSDGTMDNGFGTHGIAVVDLGDAGVLASLVVEENGQLVATGARTTVGGGQIMVLTRFKPNGELDANFGVDGVATADFGTNFTAPESRGHALLRQIDGKYVSVGPCGLDSICAARFDDDAAFAGHVGLTATSQIVTEAARSVTYTISRTGGKTGAISVNYATMAGSAQPGSDFEHASGTLTWNDGEVDDKTIVINLIVDSVAESSESFQLLLSSPTGGTVLAASEASTFIHDADGPGVLTFGAFSDAPIRRTEGASNIPIVVYRVGGAGGAVSVSYDLVSGNATPNVDFVTSGTVAWADGDDTAKSIVVDYLEDAVVEGDEWFAIELTTPTGGATIPSNLDRRQTMVITDNDEGFFLPNTAASVNENGGSVQIAVARSGASNGAASVDYSTANGTAVAGSDYSSASGTLTWAAGDASAKTIEIAITDDQVDDDSESFTVSLSNPTGGLTLAPNSTASVTIVDNDAPPPPPPPPTSGGGGATGLELLMLLGLLSVFTQRKRANADS